MIDIQVFEYFSVVCIDFEFVFSVIREDSLYYLNYLNLRRFVFMTHDTVRLDECFMHSGKEYIICCCYLKCLKMSIWLIDHVVDIFADSQMFKYSTINVSYSISPFVFINVFFTFFKAFVCCCNYIQDQYVFLFRFIYLSYTP